MAETIWELPKDPFLIPLVKGVWQHGTYYDEIAWVDDNGNPEAFPAGATATMHVKEYAGAPGPPLVVPTVVVEPGDPTRVGVLAASATSAEMNIPARPSPMTTPGQPRAFVYDVWIVWSGVRRPFAYGPFLVNAAVTTP